MNSSAPHSLPDIHDRSQTAASDVSPVEDDGRDPVEQLAAEFIERVRRGEAVTIDDYVANHPTIAEAIRELFPTILAMEGLRAFKGLSSPGAPLHDLHLERLGDFRIVREIGRGGMGIVYEAHQESLRRRVAVKVLSPSLLADAKHIERFRIEAQLAAQLHHTNIVPVFGTGEQEGLHYYVMQFIDGSGLDRVLDPGTVVLGDHSTPREPLRTADTQPWGFGTLSEPTAPQRSSTISPPASLTARIRWAVEIALQVARALQYAHDQGTLHRDIKPGNLLVDLQGVVRVTDFGLATALADDRTVFADDKKATAEIVGTLRYMAPEQFASRVDWRSDLYSLGITLYELIVGAPAFAEQDKSRLINRIRRGDLPRLTSLVPSVPRDLDAIVAKATATDPQARYQNAGALADDLQRFLDHRPVSARPLTSVGHLVRWARRNPTLATLTACLALLLVSIATVSSYGYATVQAALTRESTQRERADASSQVASDTLEKIFVGFDPSGDSSATRGERLADSVQPVLSPETASLMQKLLVYYDELASRAVDDPELQLKAAVARRRVADIHQRLGDYQPAASAYEDALTRYAQCSATGENLSLEMARTQNELGRCLAMLDRLDDSRAAHRRALEFLSTTAAGAADAEDLLFERARTHYLLGRCIRPGQTPALMPKDMFVFRSGPPQREGPPPHGPDGPPHRGPEGPPHHGPDGPPPRGPGGPPHRGPEGAPDKHDFFGPPRDLFGPPGPERRGPPPGLDDWDSEFTGQRPPGKPPMLTDIDAVQLQTAIDLLKQVVPDAHTGPARHRQLLAACYRELASDHLQQRTEADTTAERTAIDLLETLLKESPRNTDYRYDLMETLAQLDIYSAPPATTRFDEALRNLQQAQEHGEQLIQQRPDVAEYLSAVTHVHFKVGSLLQRKAVKEHGTDRDQTLVEAERSFRLAVRTQRSLAERYPELPSYQAWLARFLIAQAAVQREQDTAAKSRKTLSEAETLLSRLESHGSSEEIKPLRKLLTEEQVSTQQAVDNPREDRPVPPPNRAGKPRLPRPRPPSMVENF